MNERGKNDKNEISWSYNFGDYKNQGVSPSPLVSFHFYRSPLSFSVFPLLSFANKHFDKIRNQYKGNKIRITLLIEYLKARTLFEIRITPHAKSIMSSLNNSCWSNISRQEHLFEIRITPQARLIMSSLNDSTRNLNYVELQRNLVIG